MRPRICERVDWQICGVLRLSQLVFMFLAVCGLFTAPRESCAVQWVRQAGLAMKKVCPKGCAGGYAGRQHTFLYETTTGLPDERRGEFRAMKVKPMRCSYCGCVYSGGPAKQLYGHHNNGVGNGGWEPCGG